MIAATQAQDHYLEAFAGFEKLAASNGQGWFAPIRRAAMASFGELGFPTLRDEDWRFTNTDPIAQVPFRLASAAPGALEPSALAQIGSSAFPSIRLVFVNGRYAPALSSPPRPQPRVTVCCLAEALGADRASLEPHLARYADYQRDAFCALNTAFLEDGAFVRIPPGTILETPIHLLYATIPGDFPAVVHPRNLILAGENSQATVVEEYVSLGAGVHFSNVISEVVVGENSVLTHVLVERESPQAFKVSTLRTEQSRSSSVAAHSLLLGGALVRNNVHPVLAGEGGDCLINGLFMATDRQHMDNYMRVEHASPHCNSRQFYNGILDRKARGVFHGRIIVHKNAQKTDAKQTNKNLLLSDEAQIDTKPQLEIYADDVKCTHGATIGQLDETAVFYLRSRGIAKAAARDLLLLAFAAENFQRVKPQPVRSYLETLVQQWLSAEKPLEEAG